MEQAVIKFGGKQYLVSVGSKIEANGSLGEVGQEVKINDVLLVVKGDKIDIGQPLVSGSSVTAKIVQNGKGEKIYVSKFKAKSRYRRRTGFRALITVLEITSIK